MHSAATTASAERSGSLVVNLLAPNPANSAFLEPKNALISYNETAMSGVTVFTKM
jgi:hypothetical protein